MAISSRPTSSSSAAFSCRAHATATKSPGATAEVTTASRHMASSRRACDGSLLSRILVAPEAARAGDSFDDRSLGLVVDAQDPERSRLTLVVDADGRHGPTPHNLSGDQGLFRTVKLLACKLVDHGEDAVAEIQSSRWVALGEVFDDRGEVCLRLWREVDCHRLTIESMV